MGIVNLNTFGVLPICINTYSVDGQQIEEAQGVFIHSGMALGDGTVHAWTDPDRGSSHVDVPVYGAIDPAAIGSFLCQTCLDSFGETLSIRETPAEIALVNFSTRELRPLVDTCTWFTVGDFAVDCDFQESGEIDLLIYYAPPRFQEPANH